MAETTPSVPEPRTPQHHTGPDRGQHQSEEQYKLSSPANAAPHYPSTGRLPGVSATLAGAHKDEYLAYIRSPWWVARKAAIVLHRGYKCERCNSTRQLELHHKTYERLTRELPDDVELLCRNCHLREHGLEIHERLWGLQPLDYAGVLEEIQCRT